MKSTITAVAALLAGSAFVAAPANATFQAASQEQAGAAAQSPADSMKMHTPKVSGNAGKAIAALQKAVQAKDTAAIPEAIAAAEAAAKTADDHYAVAMFRLKAAADARDAATIASALEAMLATGAATEEEKFPLYISLGKTYNTLKQPARAVDAYSKALQLNPNDTDVIASLVELKESQGQAADAVALVQKGIAVQAAAGAKAPEAWYKRAVAIAYKAKLPQSLQASRDWLQAYPSTAAWHDSLAIFQNVTPLDEGAMLDLMRLKQAVGALGAADYFNYGDIAVRKGFAGEAKAVLEEGFAANKVKRTDPSFSQLYALATQRTKGDRESLPTSPAASSSVHQILVAGDAWYGYGDYAKAAAFYRAALAKGGAEANAANLHLGMALAREGDKAGATEALNKVTGSEAAIAKYWQIYLASKA